MMSNISMVEAKLPPGFRFHPRDEELVCDYLMKRLNRSCETLLLIEVDLNKCEPWDIPESACVGGKEWYFYSQRDRKYATGLRTNRATASGYWKATGKDRAILRKGSLVGMRKTLVFYQGRAPKGRKTDWVMHEFRTEGHFAPKLSSLKEDWVLCRVFYKKREVGAQASMEMGRSCSNYDDIDTGSSSLPPLRDSYISFDRTEPNLDEYDQQVSCFSIFSQDQTNPIFTTHHLDPIPNIPNRNSISSPFGQIYPNLEPFYSRDDNKVIKAVLNHLTKFETKGSPSLGEPSSESLLSEVGMPNMWNNNNDNDNSHY